MHAEYVYMRRRRAGMCTSMVSAKVKRQLQSKRVPAYFSQKAGEGKGEREQVICHLLGH